MPGYIIILQLCITNDDHIMDGSWDTEREQHNFLLLCTIACPSTPLITRKIKILEKIKKSLGDIIILHKHTKTHDYMLYCSWYMVRGGCNLHSSFWSIFCPNTPLTAQNTKVKRKWKKYLDVSSFYTCASKITITWCTLSGLWCANIAGWM